MLQGRAHDRSPDEPGRPAGSPRPGVLAFLGLAVLLGGCQSAPSEPWDPTSGLPRPGCVHWCVPGRSQRHSLSCESRSACDLLGYYGRFVDEDDFFAGLARSANPEEGFVGSVDGPGGGLPPAGYGVYEEPLAERMRAYGAPAYGVRGADVAWLTDQIARGRPVIVWATTCLDNPLPVTLTDPEGRSFVAVRCEHTFLAVGYDGCCIHLLDPALGCEKEVSIRRFDASWAVLGRRAVAVEGTRAH